MKKSLGIALVILGPIFGLTALWGGAYAVSFFTTKDWQLFPAIMTTVIAGIGGIAITMIGGYILSESK